MPILPIVRQSVARDVRVTKRTAPILPAFALCALSAVARCGGSPSPSAPSPGPGGGGAGGFSGGTATLVGAGDIAICGEPGAEATARLLDAQPGTVFVAGDLAYYQGTAEQFRDCYGPTWGRHRDRTRPVPGNHEYESPGAAPYFAYFGAKAGTPGEGYYSYRAGTWLVLAINSMLPLDAGSPQYEWARGELLANRSTPCTFAYWHHPFVSSSRSGPSHAVEPLVHLLYEEGADVVVAGHDHDYERFAPLDAQGRPDAARGIRHFVVGTGGATLYDFGPPRPGSEVRHSGWGVIKFTLAPNGYDWEFVPVAGESFRDAGAGVCH